MVAAELLERMPNLTGIIGYKVLAEFAGANLAGTVCAHPFRGQDYDFDVPLLAGDFVEMETGTGFVHVAPGHGADVWELCVANGVAVPETKSPRDPTYEVPQRRQ